jgi:phosphoadenosine phosphosulfate reductase
MTELDIKAEEAIAFLREHCSDKGVVQGAFSGGKDSIVTEHLIVRAGIEHVLTYSNTGIDPPEVLKFIKEHYPHCKILKPTQSFLLAIPGSNPPLRNARWCCRLLKKLPGDRLKIPHRIEGIRKEESPRRAKYPRINYNEKRDSTAYYPIFDWTEGEIWDYIEQHNLPYPSVYDEGLSRLGCIICIYHSNKGGKGHEFYRKRWPGYFKAFEHQVRKWWHRRNDSGRDMAHESPEAFLKDWYEGTASWYKKPTNS